MSKSGRLAALFLLTILLSVNVYAQAPIVSGKITSTSGGNISRVSISVKGTTMGTSTDDNGNFSISIPTTVSFPITLIVSGVNIANQEIIVKSATASLVIDVQATTTVADEIVVSATRTQTKALESPVSIERVNLNALRNAPSAGYYDIISNLKGVDFVTSSLTFKTITTRGFSGSGNTRFTQIVDGMDNQAPGLNFSVGSIVGLSELDVESMEMLPGASSALYGPGGMNGTLLINGKNPFKYQGLSVQVKEGVMHTDGKYRPASPYHNWSIRWAEKLSDKWAFKITTELIHAKDWLADDQRNFIRPTATNGLLTGVFAPGTRETDPNYNGSNTYGDETSAPDIRPILSAIGTAAPFLQPYVNQILAEGPIPVSRTGFREADVVDPNTINYKIGGSLNYKISSKTEVIFA
ncbi:MAG: carboxypeptidase-like regulatory domain-containing protein, partial [Chitinophagaceae bacterium]